MPKTMSRRQTLQGPGSGFSRALKALCIPDDPAPTPSLEAHAAHRLTFGPLPGDVEEIESLGYLNWLEGQLNPSGIDDSALAPFLASVPNATLSETHAQLFARRSQTWPIPIVPLYDVQHATWMRMLHSRRQLQERVVNFWHEHFSINGGQFIVRSMFPKWDELIRAHAFGNFRTFLEATAKHPCMLYYLDNYINSSAAPNENYARELFELHALGAMNYRGDLNGINPFSCPAQYDADSDGVRDFYIDNDVYEAARAFAGWTFYDSDADPSPGEYYFDSSLHDRFNKFVLCNGFLADPPPEGHGKAVLDLLCNHPGTARHIAFKICRRFVDDEPSEALVDSTADAFLANSSEPDQLRRVFRHVFSSSEFMDARATKLKRPLEWAVSAMRVLGISYVTHSSFSLAWLYDPMGQPMFGWHPPDGPPDVARHWASSNGLLRRWNFVYTTASGWWRWNDFDNFDYSTDGLMPVDRQTPEEIVDWWVDRLCRRGVSAPTREGLLQFLAEGRNYTLPLPPSQIDSKVRYLAALITMTPEFQRQ